MRTYQSLIAAAAAAEPGLNFREGVRTYQSLIAAAAAADLKCQIWSSAEAAAETD